jgi:hypothetical protein
MGGKSKYHRRAHSFYVSCPLPKRCSVGIGGPARVVAVQDGAHWRLLGEEEEGWCASAMKCKSKTSESLTVVWFYLPPFSLLFLCLCLSVVWARCLWIRTQASSVESEELYRLWCHRSHEWQVQLFQAMCCLFFLHWNWMLSAHSCNICPWIESVTNLQSL